jgi:hypothetical protein
MPTDGSLSATAAWHLVCQASFEMIDEEELRDWQMEALSPEGDNLGDRQGFLALNRDGLRLRQV